MKTPIIQGLHVLLVDDDDSMRRAIGRTIQRAGYAVDGFASAEALLANGVNERDGCLVLDVDLPGIDGMELKQRLVAMGHDLPTIFITALEPSELSTPLAALRPVAVLYKPFDTKDLLDAIERAFA